VLLWRVTQFIRKSLIAAPIIRRVPYKATKPVCIAFGSKLFLKSQFLFDFKDCAIFNHELNLRFEHLVDPFSSFAFLFLIYTDIMIL